MSEKHYPYFGGSFNRIVFDGDGSVWVPESENAKLREENQSKEHAYAYEAGYRDGSIHYELEHCPACKNVADLQEALAENAKLREQIERLQPTDCEGNVLDIADTVGMLRSEYDGDHEWEDVVTELVLTKWGGDRWIVRGSKGEAWACDCTKTGYDEDAYEASDDVEPFGEPTLLEVENAKLRELVCWMYDRMDESCAVQYPYAPAPINYDRLMQARARARDLGVEVER